MDFFRRSWNDKNDQAKSRYLIWVIVAFAVAVLAIIYALRFQSTVQPGVSHDDAEYLVLAESFAVGKPYRLINYPNAPLETTWPPGYPLLVLSIPWLLFGPNITLLRALNLVMVAISAVAGYKLLRIILDPSIALMATFLFVLSPKVLGLAIATMSDIAFTCFLLLFLLIFSRWESNDFKSAWGLLLSTVLLAAIILIRYWGIAFMVAAIIYLFFRRDYKRALILGTGTTLIVSLFPIFLLMQSDGRSDSYLVMDLAGRNLEFYINNLHISLFTYWKATPLLLVPLLGTNITATLSTVGLAWFVDVLHSIILLLCIAGIGLSLAKHRYIVLAMVCYVAMLLLLTNHLGSKTAVFDEPRYLVPILLFLYAGLLLGVDAVSSRFLDNSDRKALMFTGFATLVILLLARNIQQSQMDFTVADLSAGAVWAQSNTDEQAVFMTPDPISRYIYLRRHTIAYPVSDKSRTFRNSLREQAPDHLIVAPPLRIGSQANTEQLPDPWIEAQVIPFIEQSPECFPLVFEDESVKTYIYRVDLTCPPLSGETLSHTNNEEY